MNKSSARSGTGFAKIIIIGAPMMMILLLLVLLLTNTDVPTCSGAGCTQVLFIGNSYTYVNDLPATFARLAYSGGHPVKTGMLAEGGWTFADHVKSAKTQETLKSTKWDFVILQEQSEIPAFAQSRTESMYPSARLLVSQVRAAQATPLFFQTWAHLNGDPEYGIQDYATMQSQLDIGYGQIGRELSVTVAPVGDAWQLARQQNPALALWQSDASHPSEQGTYLAACMFYAVIFDQSPEGLKYTGQVDKATAKMLQAVAGQGVR